MRRRSEPPAAVFVSRPNVLPRQRVATLALRLPAAGAFQPRQAQTRPRYPHSSKCGEGSARVIVVRVFRLDRRACCALTCHHVLCRVGRRILRNQPEWRLLAPGSHVLAVLATRAATLCRARGGLRPPRSVRRPSPHAHSVRPGRGEHAATPAIAIRSPVLTCLSHMHASRLHTAPPRQPPPYPDYAPPAGAAAA